MIWPREFIVVAIDRLSAIVPKDDTHNSVILDGNRGYSTISGRLNGWNI